MVEFAVDYEPGGIVDDGQKIGNFAIYLQAVFYVSLPKRITMLFLKTTGGKVLAAELNSPMMPILRHFPFSEFIL